MIKQPTKRELLKAGVHYGHQAKHSNPDNKPNILMRHRGRDIINLDKTIEGLVIAGEEIKKMAEKGAKILFVGRKKQAQTLIQTAAEAIDMPYINKRWTGGILTNFENTKKRIKVLQDNDKKEDTDTFLTKKELRIAAGKKRKLEKEMGGMVILNRPPSALFVVDIRQEYTAVKEAKKIGLPVFAINDTNASPKLIDFPIPGNDDSGKSIKILLNYIFASCGEGVKAFQAQKDKPADTFKPSEATVLKQKPIATPKRKRISQTEPATPQKSVTAKKTLGTAPSPSPKPPTKKVAEATEVTANKTSKKPVEAEKPAQDQPATSLPSEKK